MNALTKFKPLVGREVISRILEKTDTLKDKHIVHVNSSFIGGGGAELLNSLIPLMNQIGIKTGWRVLQGMPEFFGVTKQMHNALQSEPVTFTKEQKKVYYQTNKNFSEFTHLDHDLVFVHDPQPAALVDFYTQRKKWLFRCHVDLSNPHPQTWAYLRTFINKYDHAIVSHSSYLRKDIIPPQSIIHPAIDPFTNKNKDMTESESVHTLKKYGIENDKPIISQISRFDKWKDPLGVINVFEHVREKTDCQLVLLGNPAMDDPQGVALFEDVQEQVRRAKHAKDIHLIMLQDNLLVNALQRASDVVLQKSKKEGFGLVVSEALYKKTPVVASNVGGIPLQLISGANGYLIEPSDDRSFAKHTIKLLKDEKLRARMGEHGKDHVTKNFLITRLLLDWLDAFCTQLN